MEDSGSTGLADGKVTNGAGDLNAQQLSRPATSIGERSLRSSGATIGWSFALLSSVLLALAFPNFNLWPLSWVGLVPLLLAIGRKPARWRAFLFGWVTGGIFFFSTCHWLSYSMIHYAGIPSWLAYVLLIPGAFLLGLFPASFALALVQLIKMWGVRALFVAPIIWVTFEWLRLIVTGQLWNAIGYSQAFHPTFIQLARWGGVYAVGFLIITINASLAFAVLQRTRRSLAVSAIVITCVAGIVLGSNVDRWRLNAKLLSKPELVVIAVQPNVPMEFGKTVTEMQELRARHIALSEAGLHRWQADGVSDNTLGSAVSTDWAKDDSAVTRQGIPRFVVWPESPMNFAFSEDSKLRDLLARFTQDNHTALLLNSQEPAPDNGSYNSAIMVNEAGRPVAQYDKIRLMPFGEYVPLPRWLPGSERVRGIVGGFTPGTRYTLMPIGTTHGGVFICIESAYPWIARRFTAAGADVLVNISNDGYLGPTAVIRQHLANTIFRAVENGRPVLRVTNTGITAYISPRGDLQDSTSAFQAVVRTWTINRAANSDTFYTRQGDVFAAACAAMSVLFIVLSILTLSRKTAS